MEKFTEIYKSRSDDCYYPQESVDIMAHEEIGADDLMGGIYLLFWRGRQNL